MVYYVYFDPGIIRSAAASGEAGLSCLAALLRAMSENCCIAEFDDWRVSPAIQRELDMCVPNGTEWSKRLKMLFTHLEKQNRVIFALTAPEPHPPATDLAAAAHQAAQAELDAIITAERVAPADARTQVIGLFDFAGSHFDLARSHHATHGATLSGEEHTSTEFYARFFRKILRHAQRVVFIDKMFGGLYGDHFKFTFRALVLEFAVHRDAGATNQMSVHTGNSARVPHCRIETGSFHPRIQVEIEAYDLTGTTPTLPHERYLLTDQFALEIGRGLDLFDKDSNRNRDVSLSFKSPKEVEAILHRAAASKLP